MAEADTSIAHARPAQRAVASGRAAQHAGVGLAGLAPAGNQAIGQLLRSRTSGAQAIGRVVGGRAAVQREAASSSAVSSSARSSSAASASAGPGPAGGLGGLGLGGDALVLKPDDSGRPADQMSWTELQAAIDEQQGFIAEQTSTTPEVIRRQARLDALHAAQQKLAGQAAHAGQPAKGKGKHKGKDKPPLPPRPESLEHSIDLAHRSPGEIKAELDKVIAYLAAGPPKAEREILQLALPDLEQAAGVARAEKLATARQEKLSTALAATTGTEADQLIEMLHRVQDVEKDPGQDGIWLIHHDGLVFPLAAAELTELRQRVSTGLIRGASAVNSFIGDVEQAWRGRYEKNQEHTIVHGLVKFTTDAEDITPAQIAKMVEGGNHFMGRVRDRSRAGALVSAGDDLLYLDGYAKYWSNKVGEWDSTLVGGAGRWVLALTILKESLSLLAGFGAAGLAAKAGGGFLGALKAGGTVASLTTATGAAAGGVGAAVSGGDVVAGLRAGGGAGFGVGANALTAGASRIASVADAAKAGSAAGKAYAVGKAVAVEAGANMATSVTQAAIEGHSTGDAALAALTSAPIGTLGGAAVGTYAQSKAARTIGNVVVGSASGMAGASATGGDHLVGAIEGSAGGAHSVLAHGATGAGGGEPAHVGTRPGEPAAPIMPAAPEAIVHPAEGMRIGESRIGEARIGADAPIIPVDGMRIGEARIGDARIGGEAAAMVPVDGMRIGEARIGDARIGGEAPAATVVPADGTRIGEARIGEARIGGEAPADGMRIGEARIGEARVGAEPAAEGMRIGESRIGEARIGGEAAADGMRIGEARVGEAHMSGEPAAEGMRVGEARIGDARVGAAAVGGGSAQVDDGKLFSADDLDAHFANLEGDLGAHNADGTTLYSASMDSVAGAEISERGSRLDLKRINEVRVREGKAPLLPGDAAQPAVPASLPPETWLLDQQRAGITDPTAAANAHYAPNRTGFAYDVRNAQITAGTTGDRLSTPTGPTFGEAADRVVGGARDVTFDPATGTWRPGDGPYQRPHNDLGQDGNFAPRTADEWHAWEQTHGPMTDEQRYALWFYSDDLSGHLNPSLRGQGAGQLVSDPQAAAAVASDLDQAMRPVPFDTVVHRKTSVAEFSSLNVTDPAQLANLKGSSFVQQAYASTSIESGTWSGAVELVIQVPKGTRGRYLGGTTSGAQPTNPLNPTAGAPLASMPSEMEFLVERGTSFTIMDVRQSGTGPNGQPRWTVEVRVAEQGVRTAPLANPTPLPGQP
ncbi:MAG TPA: ADP-ribosyltransferase [Mycobacteriales bacterium]|nr:ADP-ribosyltransferase [Mycobacteriales bacterium]